VDEIVFIDIDEKKAEYHAQDLADAVSWMPRHTLVRTGGYGDCSGADFVVLSAGKGRLPGQSRPELLAQSIGIMDDILPKLKASGFCGFLIGISNPADVVINYAYNRLDLPKNKVFSTGTGLDTARLRRFIYESTGIPPCDISAFALGEHGDSQTAPLSPVRLRGAPLDPVAYGMDFEATARKAATIGGFIIDGKGATEFGIGTTLAEIVYAVLNDQKVVMPVSALLEGEYGVSGIHAGVPAVIGKGGVEEIVELDLTGPELSAFHRSCEIIRGYINSIGD